MAGVLKEIHLPIILNRASLADADLVYAVIVGPENGPSKVAWIPRKDVTVDQQRITGYELRGRLRVDVLEENERGYVVATNNDGREVRWQVNKEGQILPAKMMAEFEL